MGIQSSGRNAPVPALAVTADVAVAAAESAGASPRRLMGWSVHNNHASTAMTVTLHNGTANTDPIIASIEIAAGTSDGVWLGDLGVAAADGIYLDLTGGTLLGAIYYV